MVIGTNSMYMSVCRRLYVYWTLFYNFVICNIRTIIRISDRKREKKDSK